MDTDSSNSSANSTQIRSALIIAYERKIFLATVLEQLGRMQLSRIYIAIDGPKPGANPNPQREIEAFALQLGKSLGIEVRIWRRESNLGLALSMISAIDWFFSNEETGMIIEDDVILSESFVRFATAALNRYASDTRVLMVSAMRPDSFESEHRIGWTHYPMIWGWATTSEKWSTCRALILNPHPLFREVKSLKVAAYWNLALRRISIGRLDSWAAPLASQMRMRNFLCLIPPVNFATNIGFGELATHTKSISSGMNAEREEWIGDFDLAGSNTAEIDANDGDLRIEKNNYKISRFAIFSFFVSFILDPIRFKRKYPISLETRWLAVNFPKSSE